MVSFIINVLFSIINFMFAKWLENNGRNPTINYLASGFCLGLAIASIIFLIFKN